MNRTIDDIEAEERQLKDRLIEIGVELDSLIYPDAAYDSAELNNKLPPGYKTPRLLRNEQQVIQQKLAALDAEKQSMVAQGLQSTSTLKKPGYGELDKIVEHLIKRDKLKVDQTVPSTKIAAWVKEYEKQGIELNQASIRKKLSDKGYSDQGRTDD